MNGKGLASALKIIGFRSVPLRRAGISFAPLLLVLIFCALGCETKSRARAEAAEAYFAGQQQAQDRAAAKPLLVTVKGPVENAILPWTEDLTLIKAIVAANYTSNIGPRLIRVVRDGVATEVKPSTLRQGEDMPLAAGDIIEIVP